MKMTFNYFQYYVNQLLQWISKSKKEMKSNSNKNLNTSYQQKLTQWEHGMDEFAKEMIGLGKGTLDPIQVNEEIAKLKEKSQKKYRELLELLRVPIGEHELPPLPYPYNALEPYIAEEIMRLHHQKHHQSYVDGLNKAEVEMQKARETETYELLRHWEREAAFNGAGHYLHTIFWNVMSPNGGGNPKGELAEQIVLDFGSIEKFKRHFTEAAKKVEGVGWAILVWAPRAHRLEILQAEKHQLFAQWDVIPLLVLDVWEHAYYLQYKQDRDKYINNWWNVVNWERVAYRFQEAKKLLWQPY
jgi:Fe-Mn family superoxide dismutase